MITKLVKKTTAALNVIPLRDVLYNITTNEERLLNIVKTGLPRIFNIL